MKRHYQQANGIDPMQIYSSCELSSEDYHENTNQVGGSALWDIFKSCPAQWRFREKKETKALVDGTAIHTQILEQDIFDDNYYRDLDPADHEGALVTAKDMTAWLKTRGVKSSGKSVAELEVMCTGEDVKAPIWRLLKDAWSNENIGRLPLKPDFHKQVLEMRKCLFDDPEIASILLGSKNEVSIINTESGAKCRIDIISSCGEIWDYKTCRDSSPEEFAKAAHDYGYWFKMALQADLYEQYFGEKPKCVGLIAQSKTKPYLAQAYTLTEEQLSIGREQYTETLRIYLQCKSMDCWPTYGGGIQELPTPAWIANRYEMEIDDGLEISGGE